MINKSLSEVCGLSDSVNWYQKKERGREHVLCDGLGARAAGFSGAAWEVA